MELPVEILALIDAIKNNTAGDAGELARQAIMVMKTAAENSRAETAKDFLLEQKETGKRLIAARRNAVTIPNIITRLLRDILKEDRRDNLEAARRQVVESAGNLYRNSLHAVSAIARHASELIKDGDVILTLGYNSAVITSLREAAGNRRGLKVIVISSRDGHSGERTARELDAAGMPVRLIDDTAMETHIQGVNMVLVEADRVCADGKVISSAGTRQAALAARDKEIPFYVLCESLKFDFTTGSSRVNLRDGSNLSGTDAGNRTSGVPAAAPAFDITPLEMVTAIITEDEVIAGSKIVSH